MVGIKDIASVAGVSISTVSYALNGSPRISEATRERILAIADQMNYIPNHAGRNLRRKQSNIIGVYLTDFNGMFYGEVLEGLFQKAKEHNYETIICSGEKSHAFLPERMIDGAIILDITYPDKELLQYAERGNPIVVMDRKLQHDSIRSVRIDNRQGAREAIKRLLSAEKSEERLILLTGPADNHDSQERLEAAKELLEEVKVAYERFEGDFSESAGYHMAEQIAREGRFPVSVFAFNDEMAAGFYNFFEKHEKKIGQDILLVGFDNILLANYLRPRLTTVSSSKEEWGAAAAEILINMIEGRPAESKEIPAHLIVGGSA